MQSVYEKNRTLVDLQIICKDEKWHLLKVFQNCHRGLI